jgi:hypothetical protein
MFIVVPTVVSVVLLDRPMRDAVVHRFWAIAVQHRIRVGCSEAALHGRDGTLPAVVWTRAVPYGERLWLWSPPAVTAGDFVAERERLAAACWASSVHVSRHRRWAQIVVLDVVRRDPAA